MFSLPSFQLIVLTSRPGSPTEMEGINRKYIFATPFGMAVYPYHVENDEYVHLQSHRHRSTQHPVRLRVVDAQFVVGKHQ